MIEPRHVCAQAGLCPDPFVSKTRLCLGTFVPTHVCAVTLGVKIMSGHKRVRLCPDTYFVP